MTASIAEAARAFSGHEFERAFPFIAGDAEWDLLDGGVLRGRDAIVDACRATAKHLEDVTSTFHRFDIVADESNVVIDSLAEYVGAEGQATWVASCDRYQFSDGLIARIRSYTVQVAAR